MKPYLIASFSPKKAVEAINNSYEDSLHKMNLFIFGFIAIVDFISNQDPNSPILLTDIILGLFGGICISIILFILISLLLYWVGKKLKGKAEYIDIESVMAMSVLPLVLINTFNKISQNYWFTNTNWNTFYFRQTLSYLSLFLALNIMIRSIKRFNYFSYLKSWITVSPILIFYTLIFVLILFY